MEGREDIRDGYDREVTGRGPLGPSWKRRQQRPSPLCVCDERETIDYFSGKGEEDRARFTAAAVNLGISHQNRGWTEALPLHHGCKGGGCEAQVSKVLFWFHWLVLATLYTL